MKRGRSECNFFRLTFKEDQIVLPMGQRKSFGKRERAHFPTSMSSQMSSEHVATFSCYIQRYLAQDTRDRRYRVTEIFNCLLFWNVTQWLYFSDIPTVVKCLEKILTTRRSENSIYIFLSFAPINQDFLLSKLFQCRKFTRTSILRKTCEVKLRITLESRKKFRCFSCPPLILVYYSKFYSLPIKSQKTLRIIQVES